MKTQPVVDIGILTIRDDEFKAVLKAFPDNHSIHKSRHREYTLRTAEAGNGEQYNVAILRQLEQGNGEAQEATRDFFDDLAPSLLLIVGIAGGLPSDDFSLGDVILSTRIVDFSLEARSFQEEASFNLMGGPIARNIAASVANLSAREEELGDWNESLPSKPKVNFSSKGKLYGSAEWQKKVKNSLTRHFGKGSSVRPPLFYAGVIASSDKLVKDPEIAIPLLKTARGIVAVEMESAGAHRATREKMPMLSIRGISDIVGLKRQDDWTKYACESAASFAAAYLRTAPVSIKQIPTNSDGAKATRKVGRKNIEVNGKKDDEAFANLLPLRSFPKTMYVAPATVSSRKAAFEHIVPGGFRKTTERISGAWTIHDKTMYSLVDPRRSSLKNVIDSGAVEEIETTEWAFSTDPKERRLFVQLLNGALKDDLGTLGIVYYKDQESYAFLGKPDEPPRKLKYQNLQRTSNATVVFHYERTTKKGKVQHYQRHCAFKGRFRFFDRVWYLEITPTYRFTSNGKDLDWAHELLLSGIKRIERNRSVLSQLLIWQAVLRAPIKRADYTRLLDFDPLTSFSFASEIDDASLTELDPLPAHRIVDGELEE